jgi:hypothetical protein
MLIARHGGQFTTSDNIRRRDECWNPGGAPGPDRFWHFDKPTLETSSCYKQVAIGNHCGCQPLGCVQSRDCNLFVGKTRQRHPKQARQPACRPTSSQSHTHFSLWVIVFPLSIFDRPTHIGSHSNRLPTHSKSVFFALCLIQDVDAHGKHKMASSEFLKVNSTCIWWIWCIQTCVECSHSFSC